MRMSRFFFLAFLLFSVTVPARADGARVTKVLPHYVDQAGRHTLAPSLYERDAYQAYLRRHPEERSTIRFDVHWKAKSGRHADLKLRIEMRGVKENELTSHTIEQPVARKGWLGTWSSIPLPLETYRELGDLNAWRVTLWDGDTAIAEQRSFLWE
jgi:hypothetical protein